MTQPTLNNIPIGRWSKLNLFNEIIKQQEVIQKLYSRLQWQEKILIKTKSQRDWFKKHSSRVCEEKPELEDK